MFASVYFHRKFLTQVIQSEFYTSRASVTQLLFDLELSQVTISVQKITICIFFLHFMTNIFSFFWFVIHHPINMAELDTIDRMMCYNFVIGIIFTHNIEMSSIPIRDAELYEGTHL